MSKRISPDDNISEELTNASEPQATEEPVVEANDTNIPTDYKNPFDLEDNRAVDTYPFVFCDVDFEIKRSPRLFVGLDKFVIDPKSISKSDTGRIYQHTRWLTWKHLIAQKTLRIILDKEETEKEDARGTVSINGVTYYIIKNVYIDVPEDVANIIMDSQKQTVAVGQQNLVTSLAQKLDPVTGMPKDSSRLER